MTIELNGKVTTIAQLNGIINSDTSLGGGVAVGGTIIGSSLAERGLKGVKGDKGETGETGNGISSIAKTSTSGLVDTYTITYTNGNTKTFTVTNGQDGTDGQDGHTPTITATKVGGTTTVYVDGTSVATIDDGTDGQDGADGYSPTASVSKSGDTATITITDENGTTTATVSDGADGTDGVSPTASVSKVGDTAIITITDKDGTTTATITDGQDGNITDVNVNGSSVVTAGVASVTVPTKVSDLSNDSGFIDSSALPTKVSDLSNDSGFITSPDVVYCTCSTAAGTAAKVATISRGALTSLTAGVQAIVKFTYANTNASPTLKVGTTDAKSIMRYGTTKPSTSAATSWNAGSCILFIYDGTYWQMAGWINTTYSEISEANISSSSGSTTGLITGRRAKKAVETFEAVSDVTVGGTSVMNGKVAEIPSIPTVPSDVSAFNNDAGYLTSETDPVFVASDAYGIDSTDITNWDNSYDGKVSLDTSAQAGTTDGDLYSAIVALGWENDVIE